MNQCLKCSAQMEPQCRFCGVCGAPVGPSSLLVIDGKKNRRLKQFFNKCISSRARSTVFCIIWFLGLIFSLWLFWNSFGAIKSQTALVSPMFYQVSQKLKYLKEGLPLSYIAKEIQFFAGYAAEWIFLLSGGILSLSSLFYLYYFGRCRFLQMKYREEYYCRKPLALTKFCIPFSKALMITCGVFIALSILFIMIKEFI